MKKSEPSNEKARKRGRPRSESAKLAILRAAAALLAEGGPGAVTMEAVAEKAGVGKPTVYRWYPDRHAVAMAALMESQAERNAIAKRPSSALEELRQQLHAIARRFASNTGRHVASMIAASSSESELSKAFRNHFVLARRAEGAALLERARAQREIAADATLDAALDALYGAIFFRLLLGHAPLHVEAIDEIFEQVMRGLRPARRRKPSSA
jgi:AcrR family transcriptional regulator